MTVLQPVYYDRFSCLAGVCPDSCCQMWDVQVDGESARRYLSLPGALGDRLRQALVREEDGYSMLQQEGRCPMWQEDGLCRIQRELGEEALCQVCGSFPRLRHEYGCLTELGLELSCPEAARLILEDPEGLLVKKKIPGEAAGVDDPQSLSLLLSSRETAFALLRERRYSVPERLALLLLYAHGVQEALDGGELPAFSPAQALQSARHFARGGDMEGIISLYRGLEILTPQWERRLEEPLCPGPWEEAHAALARYFVLRYWLQALSDYDLVGRVKFSLASCLLIRTLGGELTQTAQLYSKEIENDIDNVDALLDAAYGDKALTDAALLELLLRAE